MEYSTGDIVKFKLESGEIQEGDVQFIERSRSEDILYISSFNRWDRVPENRIISTISKKNESVPMKNGTSPGFVKRLWKYHETERADTQILSEMQQT